MSDQETRTTPAQQPDGHASATKTIDGEGEGEFGIPLDLPGYELLDPIGSGGMGLVYRARDTVLDRDVAVKLLHPRYAPNSPTARRFGLEARVTGKLQHPGIPPVHAVGKLVDGRPFLAMKLIKGDTLEHQLKARANPAEDRGRFIAVFEQICQAVAYAHAHHVIHRDLKPANVMVGAFGEVQVMDWGLAKSVTTDLPTTDTAEAVSQTHAGDSTTEEPDHTVAGTVMGTLAFMPPEQASGDTERLDERADVFGLGAILAVILTGKPPYDGSPSAVRKQAAAGDTGRCRERLAACGAEPELVDLCERCLSADPAARPREAGEVATAVAGLRTAADDRARQAELDRVWAAGELRAAEARADEHRKRRRAQAWFALAVATLVVVAGLGLWRADRVSAERRKERALTAERERLASDAAAENGRIAVAAGAALAADLRKKFRFDEAQAALNQTTGLVPPNAPEALAALARSRDELALVRELDTIRLSRLRVDARKASLSLPDDYRAAFAARGFDPASADPAVRRRATDWVLASPIRPELVAAIDDWALWARDDPTRDRLLALTRAADPGLWSDRLRSREAWWNQKTLARLAAETDVSALPPHLLVLLYQMQSAPWPGGERALVAAANRYRNDFWVQMEAGYYFTIKDEKPELAAAHLRAALALRPDRGYPLMLLAASVARAGDPTSAVELYREVLRFDPEYAQAHSYLGSALCQRGEEREAMTHLRNALRLDPDDVSARHNLGVCLQATGDVTGAIAEWREGIRRAPTNATTYRVLAKALREQGDSAGELALWRAARNANPGHHWAWDGLAQVYQRRGDREGAVEVGHGAVAANPTAPWCRTFLGDALKQNDDLRGAIAEYQEAVRLAPQAASHRANLGRAYRAAGDYEAAVECLREAVRRSDSPAYRNELATVLQEAARAERIAPPPREIKRP